MNLVILVNMIIMLLTYIISLVFHNQNNVIQSDLLHFNDELAYLNLSNHCVHAGPRRRI